MYRHLAFALFMTTALQAYQPLSRAQINASINRIQQITIPAAYHRLASSIRAHGSVAHWRSLIATELKSAKNASASFAGDVARARVDNLTRLQKLLTR